jgi:hypothetical protein
MWPALCALGLPAPCRAAGKAWCTPSSNMCLIMHQPTACQGPLHKSIAESQPHYHSASGPQGHPAAQAARVICIQPQQLLHRYCHCCWHNIGYALPDIKAIQNTMYHLISHSTAVEIPLTRTALATALSIHGLWRAGLLQVSTCPASQMQTGWLP